MVLPLEEVVRLYVAERQPSDLIAEKFGCDTSTVIRFLRRNGVRIRHHNDTKRGRRPRNIKNFDQAMVVREYRLDGASITSVADSLGCSKQVVSRILKEAGEPAKPRQIGSMVGEKNPNWRSDLTPEEREKRRDTAKQAAWRVKVYERDGFSCQCCSDARGGNLHAHHIEPHARNKVARWDVENGITLCSPCHRSFHSAYGLKRVDRQKLEAFISASRAMGAAA